MPYNLINTFLVQSKDRDQPKIIISLSPPFKNNLGLGRVVALASVDEKARRDLKYKTQIFISQILKYYQDLPELLGLKPKNLIDQKEKNSLFEKTLERANFLAQQTFTPEENDHLHIIIARLSLTELQFVGHGQISSFLLFKEKKQNKILNLAEAYNQPSEPGAFFNNLITGTVSGEDFLILSVGEVFDYLAINRLQKLLLQSGAEAATVFLEKTLSQINTGSFGGVIVSWPERLRAPKRVALGEFRLLSDAAIKKFIQQQGLNKFKTRLQALGNKITAAGQTVIIYLRRIPPASRVSLTRLRDKLLGWSKNVRELTTTPRNPADLFANYKDRQPKIIFKGAGSKLLNRLKGLPTATSLLYKNHRQALLVALALLIIVIAAISLNSYERHRRLQSAKFNQLIKAIESDLDEIESNFIYKNEERAATVLLEAKKLLAELPRNSTSRLNAFKELEQGLAGFEEKIYHREPLTLKSIASLPPDVRLEETGVVSIIYEKNNYSLDEAGGQILKNRQPWLKESLPAEIKIISLAIDGDIYAVLSTGQVKKFTRGSVVPFAIKGLAEPLTSAKKIVTTAELKTLYIMDPASQRLLVIDKDSQRLLVQYLAKEFTDGRDFAVQGKKIYLQSGAKFYTFDLK